MGLDHADGQSEGGLPTIEQLEACLSGGDLLGLIEKLRMQPLDLNTIPKFSDVVSNDVFVQVEQVGLRALSPETLATLYRHPDLLFVLNTRLIGSRSDYWRRKIDEGTADFPYDFQAQLDQLRDVLDMGEAAKGANDLLE